MPHTVMGWQPNVLGLPPPPRFYGHFYFLPPQLVGTFHPQRNIMPKARHNQFDIRVVSIRAKERVYFR